MRRAILLFVAIVLAVLASPLLLPGAAAIADVSIQRAPPLPPQPRPPRPPAPRPPPNRPPPYNPPPQNPWPSPIERVETRYLNQYYMDDRIDLDWMFNLSSWYWGYEVDRIEVRVANADGRSQELSLLVNGFLEDRIRPFGYYNQLHVRGFKEVGRDIRRLEIFTTGTIYIESISIYLRSYR